MQMSNKLLELKNVSLTFGGLTAVNGVEFHVNEGEILSLIGPNGAGKTSTFNLITGVYTPTSGDMVFMGKNLNTFTPHEVTKLGIARTFQNIRLFKQLTVLENIILAMHNARRENFFHAIFSTPKYKRTQKELEAKATEFLNHFELAKFKDMRAENLPYGKQRELEICRALATGAKLLLLDEPAAGLNPSETDYMMHTIKRINSELGISVFMIEHDMKMVMGISDRIVVLDYGKKIAEGKPEEIRNNQRVIDAYLGTGSEDE